MDYEIKNSALKMKMLLQKLEALEQQGDNSIQHETGKVIFSYIFHIGQISNQKAFKFITKEKSRNSFNIYP